MVRLLLCAVVAAGTAFSAEWAPAVGEAIAHYRAGRFDQAVSLARVLADASTDANVRADAAAIQAIVDLRTGDRTARLHARTTLLQIEENHPGLLERPEAEYALGIAAIWLGETNTALHVLERCFERLRAAGRLQEAADALVAIAQAWSVHGEWEITPASLIQERPRSPEEARDLRLAKVIGVRSRVEKLGSFPGQLDQVDLIVGQMQLQDSFSESAGQEILARLAQREPIDSIAAQAAFALGERAAQAGRLRQARRWWQRATEGHDAELRRNAHAALERIARSPAELRVQSRTDVLHVEAQAHNLQELTIELRGIDLSGWLAAQRGRVSEALLPEDGAMKFTGNARLQPAGSAGDDQEWTSLDIPVSPGAYVLLAREGGASGAKALAKRLVIHEPLPAVAIIGPTRGALCVEVSQESGSAISAELWIQGGFAPRRIPLRDGAAAFDLPPEARVLVSRRWTMLLRDESRIALLQGDIPGERADTRASTMAALLAGPDGVGPGQSCHVAGVLGDPSLRQLHSTDELSISLCDADGTTIATAEADLHEGLVAARLPLDWRLAPENLHVVARSRGRVVPLAGGRLGVGTSLTALRLDVQMPVSLYVPREAQSWTARWQVRWPWGAPAEGLTFSTTLRPVTLPDKIHPAADTEQPISDHEELDELGRGQMEFPLTSLEAGRRQALLSTFSVSAGAAAQAVHHARGLRGSGSAGAHAWVAPLQDELKVGAPAQFWAGWIDVREQARLGAPQLELLDSNSSATKVELAWGPGGWRSEDWAPPSAGSYIARLTVPRPAGSPLVAETALQVSDASTPPEKPPVPQLAARYESGSVLIAIEAPRGPHFVCLANDEPRAVIPVPEESGASQHTARVPWNQPKPPTRAILLSCASSECRVIASSPIAPPASAQLQLTPEQPVLGGGLARVSYSGFDTRRLGERLLFCLTRAGDAGYQSSATDSLPPPAALGLAIVSSRHDLEDNRDRALLLSTRGSPSPLEQLVRPREELLWAQIVALSQESGTIEVPIPAQGRFFRLRAISASAAQVVGEALLDADRGLRISLDYPDFCSPGDRPWASAAIMNAADQERTFTATLSGGDAMNVEGTLSPQFEIAPGASRTMRLAAGQTAWVCWSTEVLSAPHGAIEVRVEADGLEQRVQRRFQISHEPPNDPSAEPVLRMRRELFLAQEQPPHGSAAQRTEWRLEPLPDQAMVQAGQLVLVRETVEAARALNGVTWRQALPGTAIARGLPTDVSQPFRQLAQLRRSAAGALEFVTPALASGIHRHEYLMQAARPGICFLPPPEVTVGGKPALLDTATQEVRLQVFPKQSAERAASER